jgi:hypothetical protein
MKCKQNVFFSKRLEQIFIWSNFISKGIIASSTMPLMRSKELTFSLANVVAVGRKRHFMGVHTLNQIRT